MNALTLDQLAQAHGLTRIGDGSTVIRGVCTLAPGKPGHVAFLSNPRYRSQIAATAAGAVIVGAGDADSLQGRPGLVAREPHLAYARIARHFDPDRVFVAGVDASAIVAADAVLGEGCHVGAQVVIESGARIGAGSFIGPGCHVGRDVVLGEQARLVARVHIGARVRVGARVTLQPGAVVGSRGFGNTLGPQGWEEVPQLGSVVIGDDVEIGANTCIDRGAIDDTVIESGVRLDNLIQIAHNCHIGAHTAIAACTGIAGSTRIGKRCMIGGAVGIAGHLEIVDDVVLLGRSMVIGSVTRKGVYGSGLPLDDAREWRKTVARVRRLDKYEQRIKALERRLGVSDNKTREDGNEDV